MITIGIDNGSTGSIGIIAPEYRRFLETPSMKSFLGKAERKIMRVNHVELMKLFGGMVRDNYVSDIKAYIERPYTGRFMNAMLPGQRAFEATLVCLETHRIAYEVIDSKAWQKSIIGASVKGSDNLKAASAAIGKKFFPDFSDIIDKHGDADGLLIAYYHHLLRIAKTPNNCA